MIRTCL